MDFLQSYDESMDITDDFTPHNSTGEGSEVTPYVEPLQRRSLPLVTYPWVMTLVMVQSNLVDQFEDAHKDTYAYVGFLSNNSIADVLFYFILCYFFDSFNFNFLILLHPQ